MWLTHRDPDRGLSAAASVLVDLGTTRDYDNLDLDLSFQTKSPGRRALDLEDAQKRGAMLILQKPVGAGDLR